MTREFFVCYQPIMLLRSGCMLGHEILLRSPAGLSPHDLIREARLMGAIPMWELRILERAVGEAFEGKLFFNLTPEAFTDPTFPLQAARLLESWGLSPAAVCVEISEAALYDADVYRKSVLRWSGCGFFLALDDFGAGGANISLILCERPDYCKIDRTLLYGASRNPAVRKTLRSVVEMLFMNGVVPILEGVELPEDLAWLQATGWNIGVQGFAVGRPAPVARGAVLLDYGKLT